MAKREWVQHIDRPSETRVAVREATLRDTNNVTGF